MPIDNKNDSDAIASAVKEAQKPLIIAHDMRAAWFPQLMNIAENDNIFFIAPPTKSLIRSLILQHFMNLFVIITFVGVMRYFYLIFYLPYYALTFYKYYKLWKKCGFSELLLVLIMILSISTGIGVSFVIRQFIH